jgi:hypothetical protein
VLRVRSRTGGTAEPIGSSGRHSGRQRAVAGQALVSQGRQHAVSRREVMRRSVNCAANSPVWLG